MTTHHPAPVLTARRRRACRTAAAGLVAGLALSGCSLTSVASMSPDLPRRPTGTATAPAEVAAPAAAVPVALTAPLPAAPRVRGDLDAGSLVRRLDAGRHTLVVDYWTEQDPASWTADRPTVVRLSAHLEDARGRHAVKVTRFFATLDDQTAITTLADDRGEFVLTPPYSYGSALSVVATPGATSARLQVEFDLLVETAPGSRAFFRQTVLDTLSLPFASPRPGTTLTQESDR